MDREYKRSKLLFGGGEMNTFIEVCTSDLFIITFFIFIGISIICGWSMMILSSRITRLEEQEKHKGGIFDERY